MTKNTEFVEVAKVDDVAAEKAIAVRVNNRSIALFNHHGQFYATDNQCPHMGYPLIRGRTRNGVLQCDWHGWSYAMDGGGCFTGGCDDLDTFPVEVRDDRIFIKVDETPSKRVGSHYLLLKEGLLSRDNWVLSKAIAIMLAQGVSEAETLDLLVEHLGKHIASDHDANGGFRLNTLINGIRVAQRLETEDRLIPLMVSARAASGRAGDRAAPCPMPSEVSWDRLESWIRMFSQDRMWEGIEKCLVSARSQGGNDEKLIPLLYDCVLESNFLMFSQNIVHIGDIAECLEQFGWDLVETLVCNLGAKITGRNRGTPQGIARDAIDQLLDLQPRLDEISQEPSNSSEAFDEEALVVALTSGDLKQTFDGITNAIESGSHVGQILDTMVMLAGDRMSRTPSSFDPGWFNIANEMRIASSTRKVLQYGSYRAAVQALYFIGWHFFQNRWLNVRRQPLSTSEKVEPSRHTDESVARAEIIDLIESIRVPEVTMAVKRYIQSSFDTDALLDDVAISVLKHDTGEDLLGTLRAVYDEREICRSHPAREKLLVGLARFTTDVRRRDNNQLATRTAKRFARRETSVDQF